MKSKTVSQNIILEYLKIYDKLPTLTLAKKIKQEIDTDLSLESIRCKLRYYRGSLGNQLREVIKTNDYVTDFAQEAINANIPNPIKSERKSPAKILIFDIETAPIKAYVWGMWKQNINHEAIISDWFCLSWSAKWLFEEKVMSDVLTPKEVLKENDKRLIKKIWSLINEADIIIAHNANKFDVKRLNTRFIYHGLNSPSPYHVIDTLLHVRKQFGITSNRLDYLGEFFEIGRKKETGGFSLWKNCMEGNAQSLKLMSDYNNQDVLLLEELYLKIRAYIKPHPNIGLYIKENVDSCPTCGSSNLQLKSTYYTTVNAYDALLCGDCGSWSRSRVTNTPIKDNKGIKSSLPR